MSISPSAPEPSKENYAYEPAGTPRWIIVVFVAAFALIGYGLYAGYDSRNKLQDVQTDLAKADSKDSIMSAQIDQLNSTIADLKGQLAVTAQKLGFTQAELAQARTVSQQIKDQQKQDADNLNAQIGKVQQDTESKIGAVSTDLTGAKGDITATKADLDATKLKLGKAVGDLDGQSTTIARNYEELQQLKRDGERNIFELHLTKSKTPTRVGPVSLTLTKTDPKKFKYNMRVVVDDKTIDKNDKTADEPVQFYTKGAAHPYEIVIFDVTKDKVNGYLSTPKEAGTGARTN